MTRDDLVAAPWKGNGFHLSERMGEALEQHSMNIDSTLDQKHGNIEDLQHVTEPNNNETNLPEAIPYAAAVTSNPAVPGQSVGSDIAALPGEQDSVADQVMGDLEKLTQSKHNFEVLFKDFEKTFDRSGQLDTLESAPSPYIENQAVQVTVPQSYDLNVIIPENLNTVEETEGLKPQSSTPAEEPRMRALTRRKLQPPTIIDEIESTKDEIEPENPKQKEQLEMIDQFIKTQPSLTGANRQLNEEDLTTIRAGEFNDNVVSETLVEILLKQGKKDKAIEVLKKLIWKFPQKKAYFAAQIEELKK